MPVDPVVVATIRNKLTEHGLPAALLPDNATSFHLEQGSGRFQVDLAGEVQVEPGGYKVTYARRIKGTISQGEIRDLDGVKVKIAFMRVPIQSISLDTTGDNLTIAVAGQSKTVPKSAFEV